MNTSILASPLILLATPLFAEIMDNRLFEIELNKALIDQPGVSVKVAEGSEFLLDMENEIRNSWLESFSEKVPEFGFVVFDENGLPVDIFSDKVPFKTMDGSVDITGYSLPTGYNVQTVGPAGWVDAANKIAERVRVTAPSRDIGRAVDTIASAGDYITQELCKRKARPTMLVLNLTASFELVFNLETGSQVTWDLEVVCERY